MERKGNIFSSTPGTVVTGILLIVSFVLAVTIVIISVIGLSGTKREKENLQQTLSAARSDREQAEEQEAALARSVDTVNDEIVTAIREDTFKSANEEEKVSQTQSLLDTLEADGLITDVEYDPDTKQFYFTYADGTWGSVEIEEKNDRINGRGIAVGHSTVNEVQYSALPAFPCEVAAMNCFEDDPFRRDYYTEKYGDWSDALDFSIRYDTDVTVEEMQHLDDADFIIFSGHGNVYKGLPELFTKESATSEKNKLYKELLASHYLMTSNGEYVILPGFFSHIYGSSGLDKTVFFSESCCFYGLKGNINNRMADDILSCSAEAVLGYHNSVLAVYSRDVITYTIEKMTEGYSIADALKMAKAQYGNDDGDEEGDAAYPIIRGDESCLWSGMPADVSADETTSVSMRGDETGIICEGVSFYIGEDYDSVKAKLDALCGSDFFFYDEEEYGFGGKILFYESLQGESEIEYDFIFIPWGERGEDIYVLCGAAIGSYGQELLSNSSIDGVSPGMSYKEMSKYMTPYGDPNDEWAGVNFYELGSGISSGIWMERQLTADEVLSGPPPMMAMAVAEQNRNGDRVEAVIILAGSIDFLENEFGPLESYARRAQMSSVATPTATASPSSATVVTATPVPAPTPTSPMPAVSKQSWDIGDTVTFGRYMYSSANDIRDLEWRVMDYDGDYYLLTTLNAVDAVMPAYTSGGTTYDRSALRDFLINDFYYEAFNETERSLIRSTHVPAEKNPDYPKIGAGSATDDKVFIMNISMVEELFDSEWDRLCKPTGYALSRGARISSATGACFYWLTNPGSHTYRQAVVNGDEGAIYSRGPENYGLEFGKYGCVRPCIWVKHG